MVTNGDHKHNIFGKLVPGPGKKLVFFQKLVQRARSAHGARSGWRPRGRRSATAVQDVETRCPERVCLVCRIGLCEL